MGFPLSLSKLIHIVNAVFQNEGYCSIDTTKAITGINTDSRTVRPGEVFVALEGSTFDGHEFLAQVHDAGAIAAIVRHIPSDKATPGLPLLQVDNTLAAYQLIAHWWRHEQALPVVAITGSVGKTTTKELIAAVLSIKGSVLKTQANYNNEIGVPKTLLQINETHDYAVIEMGMRGLGEIAELTNIAAPDIGVITNVGTAHIGRLGSEEAIARAKCELLEHLPSHGSAILNADNQRLIDTANTIWKGKTITYGLTSGDIRGTVLDGDRLQVTGLSDSPISLPLPLIGPHNALNYLASLAVVHALQIDDSTLLSALNQNLQVTLPSGRARKITLQDDITILDETYNAGFESMTAALQLLTSTPGKRHIAVLGTMKELGDWSIELHRRVGNLVEELNIDRLLILADADEYQALANGARNVPRHQCSSKAEVLRILNDLVTPGDRILFKASRSVGLDEVVEQFQNSYTVSGELNQAPGNLS
ncbi:MAG: UDP-N-acetylmuramoyl-tripeptide--D-alanyl-D-alanine ligase [Cyanobacteria bacterium P01_F01_bin.150]